MFQIKIAGLVIGVENKYTYVSRLCKNYKVKGQTEDFRVSATEAEIRKEKAGGPKWLSRGYCEALCLYRAICRKMVGYDAFLMHSAAVAVDGEAYIFAAKSGVGKTTHMKLWLEEFGDRAQVVNGDKPVYRFLDGVLYACGTPWCGKERLGNNIMVPVKAVFFLERSEENCVRPLTPGEVIGRIFHQLLMPQEEDSMNHFMDLIDKMLSDIPFYLLQCNRERGAAVIAYRGCGCSVR